MSTYKMLVADDHELILNSIRTILINSLKAKEENINTFTSPEQVIYAIEDTAHDLYILDLEFQKLSGFDLIQSIRGKYPHAKIIVCTMHQEVWNVNRLLELDVDGIVLKSSANTYLEQAINDVLKGDKFLCPKFKEIKYDSLSYRNKAKSINLTKREKEVLELIVNGCSSKEAASQLGISENGVEKHRKNIFLKLDVENVAQLVKTAIYHRLIEI